MNVLFAIFSSSAARSDDSLQMLPHRDYLLSIRHEDTQDDLHFTRVEALRVSQFYLMDDEIQPPYPEDVTELDCRNRLKVAPHIVAIYPIRNTTVPVAVEFHESEPVTDASAWDHVADCSLDLPSGRAVILGCTDYLPDAARITTTAGCYRLRAHFGALDSADSDHYFLSLWPSAPHDLQVLKQYDERA